MPVLCAPAKINLFLHVTGRLANGYHTLDSLVGFADYGDRLHIEPASSFSLAIKGPFASALDKLDVSGNLVTKAVYALCKAVQKPPDFHITLEKNLPAAAGLGGGSADAAAVIKGLLALWALGPEDVPDLDDILLSLGADVPVCMAGKAARMSGVGERIEPCSPLPPVPILLINPQKPCATETVFNAFEGVPEQGTPDLAWDDRPESLIACLKNTRNDLTEAACRIVPEIRTVLAALTNLPDCRLSRMVGSGATCFGLFDNAETLQAAAQELTAAHPDWWVRPARIKNH